VLAAAFLVAGVVAFVHPGKTFGALAAVLGTTCSPSASANSSTS